ncbi:hypothetical protein Efla_005988 [Eimeria flavescens]
MQVTPPLRRPQAATPRSTQQQQQQQGCRCSLWGTAWALPPGSFGESVSELSQVTQRRGRSAQQQQQEQQNPSQQRQQEQPAPAPTAAPTAATIARATATSRGSGTSSRGNKSHIHSSSSSSMHYSCLLLLFSLHAVLSTTRRVSLVRGSWGSPVSAARSSFFIAPPAAARGPSGLRAPPAWGRPLLGAPGPLHARHNGCCRQPLCTAQGGGLPGAYIKSGPLPLGAPSFTEGPPLLRASLRGGAPPSPGSAEEYLALRNTVTNLADFEGGQQLLLQQEEQLQQQRGACGRDGAETYQRLRALRLKRANRQPRMKELKLTARIAEGDLHQKARQARAFLDARHQVRLTLQLRGRERLSPQSYLPLLLRLQQQLQDVAHAAPLQQPEGPCAALALTLQPRRRQHRDRHQQQQQQQPACGAAAAEQATERGAPSLPGSTQPA